MKGIKKYTSFVCFWLLITNVILITESTDKDNQ